MKQFIMIVITLSISLGVGYYFITSKEPLKQKEKKKEIEMVTTQYLKSDIHTIVIESTGKIFSNDITNVKSETSGKIVFINPNIEEGKFIKEGEIIAKIDKRDLEIEMEKAIITLEKSKLDLELEKGKVNSMKKEVVMFKEISPTKEEERLLLRSPNYEQKLLEVKNNEHSLKTIQLKLEKTIIKSPKTGYILKKYITNESIVSTNNSIIDIIPKDSYFVSVSVNEKEKALIDIGADVVINNGALGTVFSLLPEVNVASQLYTYYIKINNIEDTNSVINDFVDVKIKGKDLKGLKINKSYFKSHHKVLSFDNNKAKEIELTSLYEDKEWYYSNTQESIEIITSSLSKIGDGVSVNKK